MQSPQALYDLAPLLQMMLLGALLALGPLVWVWRRNPGGARGRRLQALTVLTLFLTFDLVLFGAFTRLTDSGLGCPDWPGCYGNASPMGAHAEIAEAQSAMPTGPVTHGKAWVEMLHRYLATSVGVLIVVLTAWAWREHWRHARAGATKTAQPNALSPWWPTLTLLWVCLQGAFGALTVTMKLFPAIVTLHLMGGVVLLVLLCVQAVHHTQTVRGHAALVLPAGLRALLGLAALLLAVQVALGGWVSTNYAVLACSSFPTCQGSWWPEMDFTQGFQIWRELGLLKDGSHIAFSALTAIHYVHRLFAYAVLLVLGLLVWRLRAAAVAAHPRAPSAARLLRVQARWLGGLALLQLATGLSNVVLDWPLVAAVLHTGGAAALAVVLAWVMGSIRSPSPVPGVVSPFCAPASAPRVST